MTIPIRFDLRPVPELDFAALAEAFGTGAFTELSETARRADYEVGPYRISLTGAFGPAAGGGVAGTLDGFRIGEGGTLLCTGRFDGLFVAGATVLEGMRNNWENLTVTVNHSNLGGIVGGLDQPLRVFGNGGGDSIRGGSGNDRLEGGPGADRIRGGDGLDRLFGGDGNDILAGDAGFDSLFGGAGNDVLFDGGGGGQVFGGEGRDTIRRGDLVAAGPDAAAVWGGAGADRFEIDREAGLVVVRDLEAADTLALFEAETELVPAGRALNLAELYGAGTAADLEAGRTRADLGLVVRETAGGHVMVLWGESRLLLRDADLADIDLARIVVSTQTLDLSVFG